MEDLSPEVRGRECTKMLVKAFEPILKMTESNCPMCLDGVLEEEKELEMCKGCKVIQHKNCGEYYRELGSTKCSICRGECGTESDFLLKLIVQNYP